jgi:hypothetical protein
MALATLDVSVIVGLVDRLSGPLRAMGGSIDKFGSAANLKRLTAQTGIAAAHTGKTLLKYTAGVVAAGAASGAFVGKMMGVASQFEKMETVLLTTEGTSARAREAMAWASDFAATTPFELDEVTGAFVKMRVMGMDPINGSMRVIGDTAAAMGRSMGDAVHAVTAAMTGENEALKAFGITGSVKKDEVTYTWINKAGEQMEKTIDRTNRKLVESTILEIWEERFSGSMQNLSKTWAGMLSNVADQWTRFQQMVMAAGTFDFMKEKLAVILDEIDWMAASGELGMLAESVGRKIRDGAITAYNGLMVFVRGVQTAYGWVDGFKDRVGGWKPILIGLGAILAGPLIMSIIALGAALVKLGAAFVLVFGGIPLLIGAAIAGAAAAFWHFRDQIGAWAVETAAQIERWSQGVLDRFSELPQKMADLGGRMIDGLMRGMTQKSYELQMSMRKMIGDAIPEWMQKWFDMRSPSRVMAGLGQNMIAGLEVGMSERRQSAMSTVQRISGGLAMSAMAATAPAAPAQPNAQISISMPITITAPAGTDAHAMADIVRLQVDKASKEAARRMRSALYDQPDGM